MHFWSCRHAALSMTAPIPLERFTFLVTFTSIVIFLFIILIIIVT
jgi:hypothetical protein